MACNVGCSVRKQEDAERVTGEVAEADLPGTFVPLVFDVTDQGGISAAVSQVSEHLKGGKLGALINNAGKTLMLHLLTEKLLDEVFNYTTSEEKIKLLRAFTKI